MTDFATAIKYIGTPAWKTKNTRDHALKQERNELSSNEKVSGLSGTNEHKETVSV